MASGRTLTRGLATDTRSEGLVIPPIGHRVRDLSTELSKPTLLGPRASAHSPRRNEIPRTGAPLHTGPQR